MNIVLKLKSDDRRHPSPDINRLRMLLKTLGRAYGFTVIEANEVREPASAGGKGEPDAN